MNRVIGFGVVLAGIVACSPATSLAQKKPANNGVKTDVIPATPQAYALLATYKEMVGTVQSNKGNSIVLRVAYDHPVQVPGDAPPKTPNNISNKKDNNKKDNDNKQQQKSQQHLKQLQQELAKAKNIKNPAQEKQKVAQIQREIANVQNQLAASAYREQALQLQQQQQKTLAAIKAQMGKTVIDHDFIDFELPLMEKAVYRRLTVGVEYDDKGSLKEAPAAPAKGEIGYPAKASDLSAGDQVKVYLAPPKAGVSAPVKKDESGAIVAPAIPAGRPQIRMVVILNDVPEGAKLSAKKK